MAFSEDVVKDAFDRVNGYCQGCGKKLVQYSRGNTGTRGGWDAEYIKPVSEGGGDTIRNCRIVCMDCLGKPRSR